MTFSLNLSNITNAIAALSISEVTVKDIDEIVGSWVPLPNVLYPNPNEPGFITDFNIEFDSVLQGTDAPMTVSYTLNYRLLGTQVGDLSAFGVAYSNVVSKLALIVASIISLPGPYSGRVTMILGAVSIGAKRDPAGNQFHGADFSVQIQEMQN